MTGSIYGVTELGGSANDGVAFHMVPNGAKWDYSVIHTFVGGSDGRNPTGVNFDPTRSVVYGTAQYGGSANDGTVFELVPNGSSWQETVLHSFVGGADGAYPASRPIIDGTTGYLYGTTAEGGASNGGTVYQIVP